MPPQKAGGSRWSQTIFTQNKENNEESKDNLAPTDGARKLLAEGTCQTERKNPKRGHSLTPKERTRQRTHQQGHAHPVKKSDGRSHQPEPVGKTGKCLRLWNDSR